MKVFFLLHFIQDFWKIKMTWQNDNMQLYFIFSFSSNFVNIDIRFLTSCGVSTFVGLNVSKIARYGTFLPLCIVRFQSSLGVNWAPLKKHVYTKHSLWNCCWKVNVALCLALAEFPVHINICAFRCPREHTHCWEEKEKCSKILI